MFGSGADEAYRVETTVEENWRYPLKAGAPHQSSLSPHETILSPHHHTSCPHKYTPNPQISPHTSCSASLWASATPTPHHTLTHLLPCVSIPLQLYHTLKNYFHHCLHCSVASHFSPFILSDLHLLFRGLGTKSTKWENLFQQNEPQAQVKQINNICHPPTLYNTSLRGSPPASTHPAVLKISYPLSSIEWLEQANNDKKKITSGKCAWIRAKRPTPAMVTTIFIHCVISRPYTLIASLSSLFSYESSLTVAVTLKVQICVTMNLTLAYDLMMKTHHINYPIIRGKRTLSSHDNALFYLVIIRKQTLFSRDNTLFYVPSTLSSS